MKNFTSKNQKIGELGEDIACRFLMKHGFKILERNYTKKWGEIDIVAKKSSEVHFIEVKTVSRELTDQANKNNREISDYRPEDNVHSWKLKRLSRTIQTYLLEKNTKEDWQFDILCVFLDVKNKKAKVEQINDIVL